MHAAPHRHLLARLMALFKIGSGYIHQVSSVPLAGFDSCAGPLRTLVGGTGTTHSDLRYYPRDHHCEYREHLMPAASHTGARLALACQKGNRFTHV